MPTRLTVKVEATILKYARKYAGMSLEEVSHKTKIKIEKLQSYEEGEEEVPMHYLERLSETYKRTLAFFFLHKVPDDAVEPKDFRMVYSSENDSQFSSKVYSAIRRARYVQYVVNDFSQEEFSYEFPSVSIEDDPEKLSDWLRSFFGISHDSQLKWANSTEALRHWKNALEEKNIFVLQQSLPKEHISAFCLADKKPDVVVLNSAEHENRRIFSLFHEVGHLLLHQSGICSPEDLSRNSYQYVQVEKFCNQIAASLLLPKAVFTIDTGVIELSKIPFAQWQQLQIEGIAKKFKVSKEVVVRRFLTLGFIEESDYKIWREEWKKTAEEYRAKKKKVLKIPQYQKCISKNGKSFISLVLDQYHSNRISFSAAADILNIKPRYIPQLEAKLR